MKKARPDGSPTEVLGEPAPAPADDPVARAREAELLLRRLLGGNRDAMRFEQVFEIEVEGAGGSFAARTVDLSRTGILLKITDPAFASERELKDLALYSGRILELFEWGLQIVFGSGTLSRPASVVRVTNRNREGREEFLVGCRFARPLSEEACMLLGIYPLRDDDFDDPDPA